MAGTLTDSDKCEPNLVPMLDMVFQLMTFFMMVVNFQATAVDRELVLPLLDRPSHWMRSWSGICWCSIYEPMEK